MFIFDSKKLIVFFLKNKNLGGVSWFNLLRHFFIAFFNVHRLQKLKQEQILDVLSLINVILTIINALNSEKKNSCFLKLFFTFFKV